MYRVHCWLCVLRRLVLNLFADLLLKRHMLKLSIDLLLREAYVKFLY